MMQQSDLIIIGSGPGGYRAAAYAARKGMTVTVMEKGEVGGTCLNRGCIPTKALCREAEVLETLREAGSMGIEDVTYTFNYAAAMARKDSVVSTLRQGVETLLSMPGITMVRGEAQFADANTVTCGGKQYTAPHIIIATGSKSKSLPVPGIDLPHVMTSTGMLSATTLPKHLCIIGAGVIGMEFASVYRSMGVEVTVVEFLKECLPVLDSDVAKRLRQQLSRRGVEFFMQSGVTAITATEVVFERKGKEQRVEADRVLVATGRTPHTDGLCLEQAGVAYERSGITVDEHLRTSVPHIYAIGDVNGRCLLAHAATMQGIHVVNQILGITDSIDMSAVPAAIFTLPEAACVGLSEDELKNAGMEYQVKKGFYRANGKALAMGESEGMLKLMAEAEGKIVGCHLFGAHAADLVQEVSVLMERGVTLKELGYMTHIHPTLSEIIQEAALS